MQSNQIPRRRIEKEFGRFWVILEEFLKSVFVLESAELNYFPPKEANWRPIGLQL